MVPQEVPKQDKCDLYLAICLLGVRDGPFGWRWKPVSVTTVSRSESMIDFVRGGF